MEVILREHIDNLGARGDVVKVAAGYARNYLLPQKLALAVTDSNKRQIEREKKVAEVKDAAERSQAEAYGERMSQLDIEIKRRVGENNTMYGSVTSADIAAALTKNLDGFEPSLEARTVGRVAEVGDGIARVSGLPDAAVNELLEFEDGTVYRAESADMAERIRAGKLGTTAEPPPA